MSESLKITLTAISGIGVFVLGQIVQKWFIEPIQEQRKLIAQILHALVYHSNLFTYNDAFKLAVKSKKQRESLTEHQNKLLTEVYDDFKTKSQAGADKLRDLSSQLYQSIQVIPCYWFLEKLGIIHKRTTLLEVATLLIEWAVNPDEETTRKCQNSIVKNLKINYLIDAAKMRELEGENK